MSKIVKLIIGGIIGILPFIILSLIFERNLSFLFVFLGVAAVLAYNIKSVNRATIILLVIILLITVTGCMCMECILGYMAFSLEGYEIYTLRDVISDYPVSGMLGYYLGIDSFYINDTLFVNEFVLQMWSNLIIALITSTLGVGITFYVKEKIKNKEN